MVKLLVHRDSAGFTLIEMSIVLVVIGLIVGGILVGQDLIRAAEARAQVSQIQKYESAVHTFQVKYGYLPGDIPNPYATMFGFLPRGEYAGEGDGNGVIEGVSADSESSNIGALQGAGETTTFWVDLSTAGLIDGGFHTDCPTCTAWGVNIGIGPDVGLSLNPVFPSAKLGANTYICVYSYNAINFYCVSGWSSVWSAGWPYGVPSISVQQAYTIDKKIDDGLPQSGSVTAQYLNFNASTPVAWALGGGTNGPVPGTAASPSAISCYDNGGNSSAPMQYSVSQNGGANLNCALSFQFQ